jgi:hypothetical protein
MLVGDIVQKIRTAITDQPQTLGVPTATAVAGGAGALLPNGNYWLIVTQRNPWGETLGAAEIGPIAVGVGQLITVSTITLPGATYARAYLTFASGQGGAPGGENSFVEVPTSFQVTSFNIAAQPTGAGQPPTRNSAYNPDTDGDSFSCATLYDWTNDALKLASQICGGLIDYAGVATIVGNPTYIVPGQWRDIGDVWYDGYPLASDKVGNFFRRNAITASVLSQVAMSVFDNRLAIEVWPQPARTAGQTTLAAPLTSFGNSLTAVSLAQFLLTNGMVQVENEIMAYAPMTGNTLGNLIRGLGGSTAAAHPTGSLVTELNLFFHGWRMYNPTFQPGQSMTAIPVPVGWETLFHLYGLARARLAEQDTDQYAKLYAQYENGLKSWYKTNRVVVGPRQVGDSSASLEVLPNLGGGWIIP